MDDTESYDYIYVDSSSSITTALRRHKAIHQFPKPNPSFQYIYNETHDKGELDTNLVLSDTMDPTLKSQMRAFVIEFWDVFRQAGVSIPILGYEMVINTSTHSPVSVNQPHYGMHETPIMQQSINKLLEMGHIVSDTTSPWASRITLAAKLHQHHVTDIHDYEWRFCINYILLNSITRPSEYPIPRCDDAVTYGFGEAIFFILLDAFSGYHHVSLSPSSIAKTAFYAPHGRKYAYTVMPYGLKNAPSIFIAMMHDFKALWMELAHNANLPSNTSNLSTIIVDDVLLYATTKENAFILARSACLIARKYHLTWKLKKCQWFPTTIEFVGVDLNQEGNSPAKSKHKLLHDWKPITTPRDVMSFIGFAIFYLRWIPFFEHTIKPLRALISQHDIDHVFSESEYTSIHAEVVSTIKKFFLDKPVLQRADATKRFYLKMDFSSVGLGFALCQPGNTKLELAAMQDEDNGGQCQFDALKSGLRLHPVAFGARKTRGNECYFHSHPGESLAASWSMTKNRHFLWGRPFTLVTDCRALLWIMSYDGHNHAVRRLQLEMLGYWFTVVNRPGRMLEDANYFSRIHENVDIDPLLGNYLTYARHLYSKNPPPDGEITCDNMPGRRQKRKKTPASDDVLSGNLIQIKLTDEPLAIHIQDEAHTHHQVLTNTPIDFVTNPALQATATTSYHNSYIATAAATLSTFTWCLYHPQHGHFLAASVANMLPFE